MVTPELCARTYTAEVLRTPDEAVADLVAETVSRLTAEHRPEELVGPTEGPTTRVLHCFLASDASKAKYHRSTRTVELPGGGKREIPRSVKIRGKPHYLYDVLIARCRRDVMIAVPYHGLGRVFFPRVDRALAGKRAVYERLDIKNLVIKLGKTGATQVSEDESPRKLEVAVTRCQLAYSDPEYRSRALEQVSMSGAHIGATDVYSYLTGPVLNPQSYSLIVTPILLGFALFANDVRKTTATTDSHGNFKIWVGPGATRIERLFQLLEGVETIEGIISTTINVPILQGDAIKGTSEA